MRNEIDDYFINYIELPFIQEVNLLSRFNFSSHCKIIDSKVSIPNKDSLWKYELQKKKS